MVRDAAGHTSLLTLDEDLDALEGAIVVERPALLVVDPITGYLGPEVNAHRDADVRRVLTPFVALLERHGVAGLGLMHPPKVTANLAYLAGGSVAFTALPRVVLGIAPDPEDDAANPRRLLAKLKGNLYGPVPTLAYRIEAAGPADVPWITWELEAVTIDLAGVFIPAQETPEDRSSRRACVEWLRAYLAEGPRPARDVEEAAREAGFKSRTIDRAKRGVVDSVKRGHGHWEWALPSPGEGRVR